MDGIPISLDVLAPSALCGLFVLLIFTGRLVPKSQVDRLEKHYTDQIAQSETRHIAELADRDHDRDEWRAAHRISEQGRQEERDHNATLVETVAKPLQSFLLNFRRASGTSEDLP